MLTISLTRDRQIAQAKIVDVVSQVQVTVEGAHHVEDGVPVGVGHSIGIEAVQEVDHLVPLIDHLQID